MQEKREALCKEMLSALQSANSILLCTHIFPDGDAIGSTLAMALALEGLGKQVTLACRDRVPESLLFLPGACRFVQPAQLAGRTFDAALAIDAADESRLGDCFPAFSRAPVRLQIDHHDTNPGYAQLNLVDGAACASGCVLMRVLDDMNLPITCDMALCLYAAISTDTGNFCFANTNAEAFACMEKLMQAGLNIHAAARPLHLLRQEPHVRLLSRALGSLHLFAGGCCAGMRLSHQDYVDCGATAEHTDKIVNYALELPGVQMAYLADERETGFTKASLRALPPYDVAQIARLFGGGGHVLAAGLRCDLPLSAFCEQVEAEMCARALASKQAEEEQ